MDKFELAWQAGLFDGEGSISISVKSAALLVAVSSVSSLVIDSFRVYDKYNEYSVSRTCRMLAWSGEKSRSILTTLLPYLRVKRKQAELALQFLDAKNSCVPRRVSSSSRRGRRRRSNEEVSMIRKYAAEIESLNSERPYEDILWGLKGDALWKRAKELVEEHRREHERIIS
jgi:hypothetical protein